MFRWPWQKKALGPTDLALELLAASAAKSGVRVTWETVLQASTALACARLIAEGIAQVPLKLYRALPAGGAEEAKDHPLYSVVGRAPTNWLTSFEWRETAGMHLAVCNRAYCYINRTNGVRAARTELIPLTPQQVRTERGDDFAPRYFVTFRSGGEEQEVPREKILHLHGPSWDGWDGLDGVRLAREAIGLALATEEHGARMFKNGATVGGILSTEANLTPQQAKDLRESWEVAQMGLSNAYRTALMWGGIKWQPRGMQNDQAQWIEVRRFQVAEVCRFYRVLPIMVGEAENTSTYASAEQMFLAHATHTMGPWYKRIEQRLDLQLLTPEEIEAGYYFRFNMTALLRGSHRDRAEFYRVMHGIGALSANEIRELEERNPYEEGDDYLVPLNMRRAGDDPEDPPEPEGDAPDAEDDAEDQAEAARSLQMAELKSMLTAVLAMQRAEPPRVEVRSGDLHLTLPENMVQVTNAMPKQEAPSVTVNTPQGPAPVVNVTTPEVKVDVAAPEVHVEAVMPAATEMRITGLPDRVTESSVERDRSGAIVKTTQTERDA